MITLTHKQTIALDALEDPNISEVLFGGGAGGAKSFLGCLWVIKMCLQYNGTRWIIGRAKLKSLKQTTLLTFFEVLRILQIKSTSYKYNAQSGEILFSNGSLVILKDLFTYPSDPNFDSLGSLEITGAFIDECNQLDHKAIEIVTSRIRYKLEEHNLTPKILMSCNPDKGWVYSEFYQPHRDGKLKQYRRFIQSLARDNKHVSPHYIENLKILNENSRQRLLFGNWEYDSDPSKLFDYESIISMWTNNFVPLGNRYITCDVARLGNDKTVVYVWDGWRIIYATSYAKQKLDVTNTKLTALANEYKVPMHHVLIDEDGLGSGLVDHMRGSRGFVNNSSPISNTATKVNFANLKSQCYFLMADKVNNDEVYVNIKNPEIKAGLIEDLEHIKDWNADKDDKIRVIPKDKLKELIGRSSDYSDGFMMRIWFDLRPSISTTRIKGLM